MTRVDVHARPSEALRCAWCHDALVDEPRTCATCSAVHHAACWSEAGACATCRGDVDVPPDRPLASPLFVCGLAGSLYVAVIPFLRLRTHAHEGPWAHLLLVLLMTVPFGAAACRLALAQLRLARGSGTRAGAPTGVDAPAR